MRANYPMKNILPRILPYLFAAAILILINLMFFSESLRGKVLQQSDMMNVMAMSQEAKSHFEKTGDPAYWTNAMFGGMPTFQIYNVTGHFSIFEYSLNVFRLWMDGSMGYYLILSLASFVGLCFFGIGPWLALIGAIGISFASNHIGLLSAGHLTKIATLGFIPMIVAGVYLIFNKSWKSGGLCFAFGLAGCIRNNHIQMTYYLGMILMFYVAAECYQMIKKKNVKGLITSGLVLFGGVLIAVLANFSLLIGLNSYAKDTMRGGSILNMQSSQANNKGTSSGEKGLGWDYATNWSNGTSDLLSILAPGAVGGSSQEEYSTSSKIAADFRRNGMAVGQDFRLPLYWGALPFTSGPDYLGITMVLLFLIGLFIVKGPIKWFALFSAIFLIIQSMGHNFSSINRLLFDYLPYYNKFRTPNSILNVLSSVVPIFAMFSLYTFIHQSWDKESIKKLFYRSVMSLGGLLLLILLLGPSVFDMTSVAADKAWKANPTLYQSLLDTRASYLRSDFFRSLCFLMASAALLYYFAIKKVKLNHLLIGIGMLTFIDLWTVAKRYLDAGDFETKKTNLTSIPPRAVDVEILKDTDLHYRVFDVSADPFNNAMPSYFHKTIGGYHPAKLRRYQDMIDYYFSKGNSNALNMMNTKYVINQDGALENNPNALGNAWFISSTRVVSTPDEEIQAVAQINPAEEAVVLQSEFSNVKISNTFSKNGTIALSSYQPDILTYKSNSINDQLAVFSEVWYGPNKGWQATIDGKAVEHIRVNYLLRALPIPAGEHIIEFKFNPVSVVTNNYITYIFGTILALLILGWIVVQFRHWSKQPFVEPLQLAAAKSPKNSPSPIIKPKTKK